MLCLTHPFQLLVQHRCRQNTGKVKHLFCHFSSLTTSLCLPWKLMLWKSRCLAEKWLLTEMSRIAFSDLWVFDLDENSISTHLPRQALFISFLLLTGHKGTFRFIGKIMLITDSYPRVFLCNLESSRRLYRTCIGLDSVCKNATLLQKCPASYWQKRWKAADCLWPSVALW